MFKSDGWIRLENILGRAKNISRLSLKFSSLVVGYISELNSKYFLVELKIFQADGWIWRAHKSSSHEQSPLLLACLLDGGQPPHYLPQG